MNIEAIIIAVIAFAVGVVIGGFIIHSRLKLAKQTAADMLSEAQKSIEREKKQTILKAKEEWLQQRDKQEDQIKKELEKLEEAEKKILENERKVNRKEDKLKERERAADQRHNELEQEREAITHRRKSLQQTIDRQNTELARLSSLSLDEAKAKLLENLKKKFQGDAANIYKTLVDEAKANANKEARKLIIYAIERQSSEYASESSVAVVNLPSEEVKGRIIGREGRNIKSFELASGVKLIVDDTPEAVVLSCFDPVQREIARVALERLVANGKIHPQRIEEVLKQSEKDVDKQVWRAGNEAIAEIGIGKIHPDLIRVLGRLHYRTSYGQNVLKHSKEVAMLCASMAVELKLDTKLAKRAGLMHDIGKAVSQSQEGTHTELGYKLCSKYGENDVVLNAILSHHEDVPADNLYSVLVAAADSISGSRPGARRDTLEGYVRRIEALEEVAESFDGVEKSYAISAGREIRVMVKPEQVTDAEADLLSNEIAQKIQEDLDYPGQVKVTVIRETRATAYA